MRPRSGVHGPRPCRGAREARLRGLYALTDPDTPAGLSVADCVADYLAGGAAMIQYRDKGGDHARRATEARELLSLCRRAGVPLIVNDDVELAAEVAADGVHLGRDDPGPEAARRRLGPGAIIGVSCYDRLERAHAAVRVGADYVAFGSFFPSPSKPRAVRATPGLLSAARPLGVPLVAIGGVTPDNAPELIEAGADMVAVIRGLLDGPSPREAARAYARLFETRAE